MSPDVPDPLASGLLDRDWVGAQLGTVFASDEDAAARCLDPEADCSPHPLYEPTWGGASPHPLVDVARIVAEHPDAARHPHGPLAWWVASAREDTPVPVPEGVPEITWGRLRGAALEAAERRAETDDVRVAQRRTKQPPSAQPAPPPLPEPGDEPLVSVVLAVSDDGPRLRAVVDTVQAQSYGGWELVVVDDGSADDTTAVLAGIATFEPRVVPMSVPRGGLARARNAALARARGKYVAFVDPDHTWHPDFLAVMLGHLEADGAPMAHAAMRMPRRDDASYRAVDGGRDHLLAHEHVDLAAFVARLRGGDRGRRFRRDARRGRVPGPAGQAGRDGADAARAPGAARPRGGRAGRRPPLDGDGPGAPPRRLDDRAAPAARGAAGQHRAAHDGRPRPHGALGDPDDVPAPRERRPRAGRGGCPAAEGRRAPARDAARDVPERASARAARPDRSGRLHQPRDRGDQRGGGRPRAYLGQPAARRVPRPDVGPVRPRRRHRPAAGGRPAGAGRQCRRGVRAGPHPPRAVPGRSSGDRRPGPRLAGGTRPAVARGGGPGLGAGPPARLRRLDRRRAARGRARCPDGRARWWRDGGRAPVAAGAQGRPAAAARHRLRRRPRAPGAVAGVAARVRGGLGPRGLRGRRSPLGGPRRPAGHRPRAAGRPGPDSAHPRAAAAGRRTRRASGAALGRGHRGPVGPTRAALGRRVLRALDGRRPRTPRPAGHHRHPRPAPPGYARPGRRRARAARARPGRAGAGAGQPAVGDQPSRPGDRRGDGGLRPRVRRQRDLGGPDLRRDGDRRDAAAAVHRPALVQPLTGGARHRCPRAVRRQLPRRLPPVRPVRARRRRRGPGARRPTGNASSPRP